MQLGVLLSTLAGEVLPPETDTEALKHNESWRFIFFLQPALYILVLILFYIFVGHDPPKYLVLTGQEDKAKKAIEKIYHCNGD